MLRKNFPMLYPAMAVKSLQGGNPALTFEIDCSLRRDVNLDRKYEKVSKRSAENKKEFRHLHIVAISAILMSSVGWSLWTHPTMTKCLNVQLKFGLRSWRYLKANCHTLTDFGHSKNRRFRDSA